MFSGGMSRIISSLQSSIATETAAVLQIILPELKTSVLTLLITFPWVTYMSCTSYKNLGHHKKVRGFFLLV